MTTPPSRDDAGTMTCPVCQRPFTPTGRQRYCGDRCRKTAFRRRHQEQPVPVTLPAARPRREHTIYQCPDCATFARRVGPGSACPHCGEPVAIADLTQEVATMPAGR